MITYNNLYRISLPQLDNKSTFLYVQQVLFHHVPASLLCHDSPLAPLDGGRLRCDADAFSIG